MGPEYSRSSNKMRNLWVINISSLALGHCKCMYEHILSRPCLRIQIMFFIINHSVKM